MPEKKPTPESHTVPMSPVAPEQRLALARKRDVPLRVGGRTRTSGAAFADTSRVGVDNAEAHWR